MTNRPLATVVAFLGIDTNSWEFHPQSWEYIHRSPRWLHAAHTNSQELDELLGIPLKIPGMPARHCGAWAGGLLGKALVKGAGLQWEGGFLMHRYNLTTTGPKGEVDTSPRRPLADRTIHTDRAGTSLAVWGAT